MEENEVITISPQIPQYTCEEFKTPVPYQYLCDNFSGSEVAMQFATLEMAENAKAVGFTGFKDTLKIYLKQNRAAARRGMVPNTTEFTNQPIELNCAAWECWDGGIYRIGRSGLKELACSHPIIPVERLKNIDTGEVKVRLAFNRSGRAGKWQSTIVDMATISTTRTIVPALANLDISVTGNTAPALVDYLNEIADLNRDIIPEQKSIGRLGYIPGEGFSPYVDGLVFDGDASFKNLYGAVSSKGNMAQWQVAVYKITSLDLDIAEMLNNLESAGWRKTECTISGKYSFFLKGTLSEAHNNLTEEECMDLAKAFMVDSGLSAHIGKYGVFECAYESSVADGLVVTYCYFLCEGERTGAYIRFVFEGHKHIGEIQANVYSSECIDNLTLLQLDDALETAYMVNSEGKLEEINADEFRVQNVKLVYVNGLPYYKFAGFGRNTRLYINGFALAVDVDESAIQEQLLKQHADFKFE